MADEIAIRADIRAAKGGLSFSKALSFKATLAGSRDSGQVQDIGTTDEQVLLSADMASAGWSYFINLDGTNYVTLGVRDGSAVYIPLLKLKPGEGFIARLGTTTFYAKANTAAVKIEFGVLED
jgi:hypothetical protein